MHGTCTKIKKNIKIY